MFKNMFKKTYTMIDIHRKAKSEEEPNIPEGLWRKCNKCGQPIYVEDVRNNLYVCPKCGGYSDNSACWNDSACDPQS